MTEGLIVMEHYRIIEGVAVYFITFTVVEWLPVFIDESNCKIVTDSLNYCISNKNLRVSAYVIMPTHMHAVVHDNDFDSIRLKNTLDNLRKFTGRRLADAVLEKGPACFNQVFARNAGDDRLRRFWQSTQHPEGITNLHFMQEKVNYIHLNPVRKGLVRNAADWRFSSASFWLDGIVDNDVILTAVDW